MTKMLRTVNLKISKGPFWIFVAVVVAFVALSLVDIHFRTKRRKITIYIVAGKKQTDTSIRTRNKRAINGKKKSIYIVQRSANQSFQQQKKKKKKEKKSCLVNILNYISNLP